LPQDTEAAAAVVTDIQQAGGEAFAFQADVGVRSDVLALVDATVKRWGQLDILVNNAAIAGQVSMIDDESTDNLDRVMAVNYKGTLWGIQAASKVLKPGGSIVNISSIASTHCWPVPSPLP
jgi:NAD(P)-dependent dehydrogenase (short-subunit alcohol dehydrogenase family)